MYWLILITNSLEAKVPSSSTDPSMKGKCIEYVEVIFQKFMLHRIFRDFYMGEMRSTYISLKSRCKSLTLSLPASFKANYVVAD